MNKTIELEILIESIKVSLLDKSSKNLAFLLKNKNINWRNLERMTTFHAIRPVVYDAFQRLNFENDFSKKLKQRTFTQAITNLATSQELARLLGLLQSQNIRVLPYKGLLFISELYQNKPLREAHDLDLLIHPEDAKLALNILLEDGYKFDVQNKDKYENNTIIESLFKAFSIIEVGLDKKTDLGINIHIDFHWRLYEDTYNFKINYEDFFINQQKQTYLGKMLFFPSKETIFFMLLNHHGGRESWVRLKHFCDLIAFFKTQTFTFQELDDFSTTVSMKRIFEVGFEIYQSQFLEQQIATNNRYLHSRIFNYWETADFWLRLDFLIRFQYIYVKLQDNFLLKKYLLSKYKYLSKPNLIENPRLITFPDNYPLLNFTSKLITLIWKKTFKKIFSKIFEVTVE